MKMKSSSSPLTPLETLRQIADTQARVDAVAADLSERRRRFVEIGPWEIAEALSMWFDNATESVKAIWPHSLADFVDEFPAWNSLALLKDRIPQKRYEKLQAQGDAIRRGARSHDISITPKERELVEQALAEQSMNDGGGWIIERHILRSTDGTAVCFEVTRGDAGALTDLVGPYEIHDGGWPDHRNTVFGERW